MRWVVCPSISSAKYDDEGFYRQWWTNSTVEAFGERAQCIADQYSKFYVLDADGKKVYVKGASCCFSPRRGRS